MWNCCTKCKFYAEFLNKLLTVFHSNFIILYSCQGCVGLSFLYNLAEFSWFYLLVAIVMCVQWYLMLVWFCGQWSWMSLHVFTWSFLHICSLVRNVYSSSPLFFNWLDCRNSLYIMSISPLLDKCFAYIFYYSTGCFSTLLIMSFGV